MLCVLDYSVTKSHAPNSASSIFYKTHMKRHISIENRQRQHYSRVASTYSRARASNAAKIIHNYIDSFIPYTKYATETSTVLLLGCGSYLPDFTRQSSAFVVGLDLSMEMLQILNRQHPHLPLIQGSGFSLPFQSQSIHMIVARGSLHHMPELSRVTTQISNSLVTDGILIFLEPFSDWIVWRVLRSIVYSQSSQLDQLSEEAMRYEILKLSLEMNHISIISMRPTGLATFLFLRNSDISPLSKLFISNNIFRISFYVFRFLDRILEVIFSRYLWIFPELIGIAKKTRSTPR